MSLEEAGIPRLIPNTSVFKREINRYTLLGEFDSLFVSLLKVWINKYGLEQNNIDDYMVAHMHRGIDLVYARMKSIADLSILIPKSNVGEKDNEATDIS
jgi:DNA sulfur modification protein DndE